VTLIELLVVIMIIGILIGLLLTGVHAAMVMASITQVRSDLKQIQAALSQYMAFIEHTPPTRPYTGGGQYDLDYCLPQELFPKYLWGAGTNPNGTGYLDGPLADPFQVVRSSSLNAQEMDLARGYRYKSLEHVPFIVPADFPKSTGEKTTYTPLQWFKAPVRLIVWSAGPGGPPVKTCYTMDEVNAENPANWYPEKSDGIICLYYDGKDWLFSY